MPAIRGAGIEIGKSWAGFDDFGDVCSPEAFFIFALGESGALSRFPTTSDSNFSLASFLVDALTADSFRELSFSGVAVDDSSSVFVEDL